MSVEHSVITLAVQFPVVSIAHCSQQTLRVICGFGIGFCLKFLYHKHSILSDTLQPAWLLGTVLQYLIKTGPAM